MSVSLRNRRALVGIYADGGSQGDVTASYVRQTSGDPDHCWWASKMIPSGEEVTTGMKAEHRLDARFGFSAYAPVTENGAIQVESVDYLVRAIKDRDYGRDELIVEAERAPNALTWTGP